MKSTADKIADQEAEVMKVIWSKGGPATYSEIRSGLSDKYDWGGQVINTMLKRLVKKGVLEQEKRDVYYYTPLVSETDYMKEKTMIFLQKMYGGSAKGLISALIDYQEVSQEDLKDLQNFWDREKRENGNG